MSNKETVQKALDARKDVNAAKKETQETRQQLEEAGHEMVRMQISHENDKNYWCREKSELVDMIIRERGKNKELEDSLRSMYRREKDAEQRGLLADVVKLVIGLILIVAFRDLDLINVWLAAVLSGFSIGYLAVAVYRLAFKK